MCSVSKHHGFKTAVEAPCVSTQPPSGAGKLCYSVRSLCVQDLELDDDKVPLAPVCVD